MPDDLHIYDLDPADTLTGTEKIPFSPDGYMTPALLATYVSAHLAAGLLAIAALTPAADKLPYYTGASTASLADFTAAGRALVGAANAGAQRTALGLDALATVTPGTGVATALAVNVGSAGAILVNGGALGTPASGVATNLTGTAAGLTAGNATLAAAATVLATPRAINGVAFDGSAAITVTASAGTLTGDTLAGNVTASSLTSAAGGAFGSAAYTASSAYDAAGSAAAALASATAYTDAAVTGLLDFKGDVDASGNPNYSAASKGDAYYVSVAGKIGGASGKSVEVGDVVVAKADNAGGAEASVGTSWFVMEHNLVGAAVTSGTLAQFAATTSAQLAGVISDETGSGALVFANTPTLVSPLLGTPTSGVLTNCTGLPVASGISGLGTGIATALAVNVGSAGAPVVNGGALGTPSSGTLSSCTGLPISTGVSGLGTGVATALAATPNASGGVLTYGNAAVLTANTFTALQTVQVDAIGTAGSGGVTLTNTTAAAAGAQQYSPALILTGQGWKTTATAASQTVNWMQQVVPVQGTTNPTANLVLSSQINGSGYTAKLTLGSDGSVVAAGTIFATGSIYSSNTACGLRNSGGSWMVTTGGVDGPVLGAKTLTHTSDAVVQWRNTTDTTGGTDIAIGRDSAGVLQINSNSAGTLRDLKLRNVIGQSGYHEMIEMSAPSAPAADGARIYAVDNGAGKTQLMVIFSSGAAQQLAIQP